MYLIFRKFFVFVSFLVLLHSVQSQEPFYYAFDDVDGFPVKQVYEMYQDKKGHIWIGSNNGLYEYNGTQFNHIKLRDSQSGSVSSIFEDQRGRIWCRNFRGQVFYAENQQLFEFINWKDSIRYFPSFAIDNKDQLFITSKKGIYVCDLNINQWRLITNTYSTPEKPISYEYFSLFKLDDGQIAFSEINSQAGYIRNDSVIAFSATTDKNAFYLRPFSLNGVTYFFHENNIIYLEKNDRLIKMADLKPTQLSKRGILWSKVLSNGMIAIGATNGLYLLDSTLKVLNKKPYLKDKKVSSVIQDKENNLWLSTLNNGIFMIPNPEIKVYNTQNSQLPENSIYALETNPQNQLLVGTAKGYVGCLNTDGTYLNYYSPDVFSEVADLRYCPANNTALFLQWANLNEIINSQSVKMVPSSFLSAPKEIKCYDGNILIPANNGINWYVLKTGNTNLLSNVITKESGKVLAFNLPLNRLDNHVVSIYTFRSNKKASSVAFDMANKRLWGVFSDGTFYFDATGVHELLMNQKSVLANKIISSSNSEIWLGGSSGLLAINDTQIMHQYKTRHSIVHLFHKDETIWYVTIDGLFKLDLTNFTEQKIDKTDGIASHDIHDFVLIKDTIYLATPKGVISFNKNQNFINKVPPVTELEKISIAGKDTNLLQAYNLKHKQNYLAIYFNGIAYKSKGLFTYKFRMKGLNNNWTQVNSNENIARYYALPPGEFTFEVKANNEDGFESVEAKTIQFYISPPFWQTTWFYILVLGFISSALISYFKIRIRIIKHQNHLEKLLKASEITAIKAQMNPHFIFNALNSIQDLILQHDFKASNSYLGKFSDLLRQVLEMSGKDFVSLAEELRILEVYLELEKLRFSNNFAYQLSVEELPANPMQLSIPSMIIQPYVENAIKHGLLHKNGAKELKVIFKSESNQLVCSIIDNGVGRAKAHEIKMRRSQFYKSFATSANKKRIDLFNELNNKQIDIKIEDLYDQMTPLGTSVKIKFPIHFMHQNDGFVNPSD